MLLLRGSGCKHEAPCCGVFGLMFILACPHLSCPLLLLGAVLDFQVVPASLVCRSWSSSLAVGTKLLQMTSPCVACKGRKISFLSEVVDACGGRFYCLKLFKPVVGGARLQQQPACQQLVGCL